MMELLNDCPPHPAASEWSIVYATGNLRILDGVLQQEFAQDWANELGGATRTEWRDVPEINIKEQG